MDEPITPASILDDFLQPPGGLRRFCHKPLFWVESATDYEVVVRWKFSPDHQRNQLIHDQWKLLCDHLECSLGGHECINLGGDQGTKVIIKRYSERQTLGFRRSPHHG